MNRFAMSAAVLMLTITSTAAFAQTGVSPRNTVLVSGFGYANYIDPSEGPSNFAVGLNPVFLWQAQNDLFFEAELEFELEDGVTNTALEYAQAWWVAGNSLTFGAGKFLNPTNIFAERYHPTWINKLPNGPLGFTAHGGVQLTNTAHTGVQARGGIPIASGKFTYAVFLANGPAIHTEVLKAGPAKSGDPAAGAVGTLDFNGTEDNNDNKLVGGRFAVLPWSSLEIGYGFEAAKIGDMDSEFADVGTTTNSVDLIFNRDVNAIRGHLDIRGQYVNVAVDNPGIAPLDFDNNSSAWYSQLSYRPSKSGSPLVASFEGVFRYEELDLPEGAPVNADMTRLSFGLNRWFSPSTVFKLAYQKKTTRDEVEEDEDTVVTCQFAMGF